MRDLPVGWSVGEVAVNDGRSVITMHHDRAGGGAMVARLTAGCDVGQAAEEASGREGVRRYQRVERQTPYTVVRFEVFPGGCVTTRIKSPPVHRAEVMDTAAGILGFTPGGSSPRTWSSAPADGSTSTRRGGTSP